MGNCLITKLKGVVDNPNLSFFDSVSLRYVQQEHPSNGTQWLSIAAAASGPVVVEALDGGTFSKTYGGESIGSTFTVNSNTTGGVWVSNTTCRIIVHNKQNIKELTSATQELCKDFDYATRLEILRGVFDFSSKRTLESLKQVQLDGGSIGDLKNITSRENLVNLGLTQAIHSGNFSGSLEDLSECRALESLFVGTYAQSAVLTTFGGNISSIANNPLRDIRVDKNLSIIGDFETLAQCLILYYNKYGNLNNMSYMVSNSSLSGSVQAFVNACVDGGVTSGTISVPYLKTASGIYSDIAHTLLIKDDPSVANPTGGNTLSWSSDKTWTVS